MTANVTSPQIVLFIGGLGRSGSTLVEKLLNQLPQAFSVGETIHLWERGVRNDELCGCGARFSQCRHWAEVGQAAFKGWDQINLDEIINLRWAIDRSRKLPWIARAHHTGILSNRQATYVRYLSDVLLASAQVAGNPPVLLESSKHLSTAALLALDPALDVRLLHLIRDSRGVAYSWTKRVPRPETETSGSLDEHDNLMPMYRTSRTAGRWFTDNLGFEALARQVPSLRVRYEDLLADPGLWLTRIGQLVDIDPQDLDLGFLDGKTATVDAPMHSVAGNPLRFNGSRLTLTTDDAWRKKLTPTDYRLVTTMTAPMLATYGYQLKA